MARLLWYYFSCRCLFGVMILGMVSKVYYDHLTKNTVFSISQIVLPMLVAPMVYGAIYASLRSSTDVIPALILAFQNGFFLAGCPRWH